MGNHIEGKLLLEEEMGRLPSGHKQIRGLFADVRLDFPVIFTDKLPLGANRFGMAGITLGGRVWLLHRTRKLPAIEVLALLRHEAEHVRQQRRRPFLFYPLYAVAWLRSFLHPWPGRELRALRRRHGRPHAAYRAIPYEVEAYSAGDDMRTALRHITQP